MKGVSMCLAIEEMRNDSKLEGTVETYKEVGFSLQGTVQRIADKFHLTLQQAEEETKKYWQ